LKIQTLLSYPLAGSSARHAVSGKFTNSSCCGKPRERLKSLRRRFALSVVQRNGGRCILGAIVMQKDGFGADTLVVDYLSSG